MRYSNLIIGADEILIFPEGAGDGLFRHNGGTDDGFRVEQGAAENA